MRIQTNTTLTPSGKVRVRTAVKAAPMLPTLRTSTTFSVAPKRKKRRTKKKR